MRSAAVLVLALVATSSLCVDGAVLLRFINTVPTRTPGTSRATAFPAAPVPPAVTAPGTYLTNREVADGTVNINVDRVGLTYSPPDGSAATTVWTEIRAEGDANLGTNAPYAWIFAMPPLRAYHGPTAAGPSESNLVDRIAWHQPTVDTNTNNNIDTSCDDFYTQTQLKADGVGLYLSFAPGRYTVGAYGVRGNPTSPPGPFATAPTPFTSATKTFDFVDNMVYTLIAIGNGNFNAGNGAGSFGDTATVSLVLLQESTAPTTFGMASFRFFHAIQSQSDNAITIKDLTTAQANTIVNGLAFGAVSDYIDVAPTTRRNYNIVRTNNANVLLAPTDALANGVSFDVRAGVRATLICANTDSQNPTVFCRMIPSRVVAYVRLINDNFGNLNFVTGTVATQRIQDLSLSLWASYSLPYPTQVHELSQHMQSACLSTSASVHANKGLYPVVVDVPVNSVSDYGEVHVPVFLMDYAVRFLIRESDCTADLPGAAGRIYTKNTDNPQDLHTTQSAKWFETAPIFKRVNFIVKTPSLATLSGAAGAAAQKRPTAADPDQRSLLQALLLNEYMEPGQYYSIAAFPNPTADALPNVPVPNHIQYQLRLDWTIDVISAGISAGKGLFRVSPLPHMAWGAQKLAISGVSSSLGPFVQEFITAQTQGTGKLAWVVPNAANYLTLSPSQYSYSATDTGAVAAPTSCNIIPSGTFTLAANQIVELFVLGRYACTTASTSLVTVIKSPARVNLGSAVCNPASAPPTTTFLFSAATPAASSTPLALLAAAVMALVALMF